MGTIINGFNGEYRFLSNFWMASIEVGGRRWASAEHCYQAAKSLRPRDWDLISNQQTAGGAKRAGRYVQIRDDWNEVKLEIMEEIVQHKFDQHESLQNKLLATGSAELIERNTWGDTFWGKCGNIGHNHLGKILMKIRENYR